MLKSSHWLPLFIRLLGKPRCTTDFYFKDIYLTGYIRWAKWNFKKKLQACIASKELKIEVKATSGQRCAKLKGTPSCHKSKGRPKLVFYTCIKKGCGKTPLLWISHRVFPLLQSVTACVCVCACVLFSTWALGGNPSFQRGALQAQCRQVVFYALFPLAGHLLLKGTPR